MIEFTMSVIEPSDKEFKTMGINAVKISPDGAKMISDVAHAYFEFEDVNDIVRFLPVILTQLMHHLDIKCI